MPQANVPQPGAPRAQRPHAKPARPASPVPAPRAANQHPAPASGDPAAPKPPPDPRARWIGLAAVLGAALFALVVTVGVFLPALAELASGGGLRRADAASPPAQLLACGREYALSDTGVGLTLTQVRAREGQDPIVVSAEADAGCATGVCREGGFCVTLVYVRTTDDRYLGYELQGGP